MEDEDHWYNDESDYDDLDDFDDKKEDNLNKISDADVFMAASLDRDSDRNLGVVMGSNYGAGINLNELTDEQRSLYDSEYYSNPDMGDEDF